MFDGLKYLFDKKNSETENTSESKGKNNRFLIVSVIVIIIIAINVIMELTGYSNVSISDKKSVIQIIQEDLHIGVIDIIVLLVSGIGLIFVKLKKGK